VAARWRQRRHLIWILSSDCELTLHGETQDPQPYRWYNSCRRDLMQYESFKTKLLHYIELSVKLINKLLKLCNLQCAACSYLFICRINSWLLESKIASAERVCFETREYPTATPS
jgi:hypothetical protein